MYVTERLELRAVEEADIAGLRDVYLSNPQVIAVTEGSAGAPGHYDRGMLERDLWMSELDQNRHTAGLFGREAVQGLIVAGRESGWTRVRASALAGDPATTGLYEAVGMRATDRRTVAFAAGERSVVVFELEL